jgi:hypothetical protein
LPTVGTAIGKIEDENLTMAVLAPPVSSPVYDYVYGTRHGRCLILRGVAQYVAVNLAGAALAAGGVFDIKVEWTESPL